MITLYFKKSFIKILNLKLCYGYYLGTDLL